MMGLLYLLLCFLVGWAICSYAFPRLSHIVETDYLKRRIAISPYQLLLPVWFVTGTLALTWSTYLIAYLCKGASEPLQYANLITMPVALLASVLTYLLNRKTNKKKKFILLCKDQKALWLEFFFIAAVTILACVLMWTTFFVRGDELYVGVTVFSDFSPHVGMIRSFSYGNNFPTTYPHFAGEDIKYHFMFQFLAGNLEYLGLRIDYAFNIPSILSFVSAFMLLYLLAVKITGKLAAGVLACLFFAFRSSKTLFTYLTQIPEGTGVLKALTENSNFISSTPNEDWGLWNLNVYCNQRHLAFGLTVIFFVLLLFLPHVYAMFENRRQFYYDKQNQKKKNPYNNVLNSAIEGFQFIFLTKKGWEAKDYRTSIAIGVLLGSLSFFHGAAVIGILSVLFVMAGVSVRRLEYLITAVIAMTLSFLQTGFFIQGSAVSPEIFFGFIAENKTLFGVASYLERLLGILPFVLIVAFCLEKGVGKYVLATFTAPLIFAFCISLTIDVTVNHKYIMMSCILLGIFAAAVVDKLLKQGVFWLRITGLLLIVLLTATGIYDFTTVLKKNTPESAIVLDLKHPLTEWINENSTSQDIFLTSNYTINQVVLGGAMLYEGWPYYPWSAGYDTQFRTLQVKEMYEAATPLKLTSLVKANNVRFIIVDRDNRESSEYVVNEENIRATYECVYTEGTKDWNTSIYDTKIPIQ